MIIFIKIQILNNFFIYIKVIIFKFFCKKYIDFIFSAKDILNVEFISINETALNTNDNNQAHNNVTVKRPIAKRAGRSFSESVSSSVQSTSSQTQTNVKKPNSSQSIIEQSANGKIPLGIIIKQSFLYQINIKY